MWDARYAEPGFAYGTEPNDFLRSAVAQIPPGRVLTLGEGEGRNSVFLAEQGFDVVAVDQSRIGLAKADRLARERGVKIETITADLAAFDLGSETWSGIVAIFCHLPPALRRAVHAAAVAGLRPGGVLVLEAYTPEQLELGTGGPPSVSLMMSLEDLREDLAGLELRHGRELRREIHEGVYHDGVGAVVQILGVKPEA